MENIEAQKLINRMQKDIISDGIDPVKLIKDLKKLRTYALEEENPTLVKVLRLTYEHIDEHETFHIPIPEEMPVEEIDGAEVEHETTEDPSRHDPAESLQYLLSIISKSSVKANMEELKEYRNALLEYATSH